MTGNPNSGHKMLVGEDKVPSRRVQSRIFMSPKVPPLCLQVNGLERVMKNFVRWNHLGSPRTLKYADYSTIAFIDWNKLNNLFVYGPRKDNDNSNNGVEKVLYFAEGFLDGRALTLDLSLTTRYIEKVLIGGTKRDVLSVVAQRLDLENYWFVIPAKKS